MKIFITIPMRPAENNESLIDLPKSVNIVCCDSITENIVITIPDIKIRYRSYQQFLKEKIFHYSW